MQKFLNTSLQLPQAKAKLTQCEHKCEHSMLFPSPGIIYHWLQAFLHGVITMQHLLLTFRECMQTLLLRR